MYLIMYINLLPCVQPISFFIDGDKDRSQQNIMERLVALCKSQSSKSVPEPVKKSPNHIR